MPTRTASIAIVVILIAAAVIGASYYYLSKPSTSAPQNIEFGISVPISEEFIPAYVAEHGGFWKQEGLNVTIVPFKGDVSQMEAVAAGQIQFGSTGEIGSLISASQGTKFQAIAMNLAQADMVLYTLNSSKYTSCSQIKGATIAITSLGSLNDIMVRILAQRYNWTVGKNIFELSLGAFPAKYAALVANKTQVEIDSYDLVYSLEAKTGIRVLCDMSTILPNWVTEVLYASNNMISNHPNTVRKVLQGYFNAVNYCRANETYCAQMTAQYEKTTISVARQIDNRAFLGPGGFSTNGTFTTQNINAMNYERSLMLSLNISNSLIPVSQYYTTQFTPISPQNVSPEMISTNLFIGGISQSAADADVTVI